MIRNNIKKLSKSITYNPLNHRLLGEIPSKFQLGRTLYLCLENSINDDEKEKIKERLNAVERHQEAEEGIIETLIQWDHDAQKVNPTKDTRIGLPIRAVNYKSLFKQFGEDLIALLDLDINMLSKSRILLYLECLTNLYALLYYLRIICKKEDTVTGKPPPGDLPLVLPLCSNESDDSYKTFSDVCLQLYRQKAVVFWREYLLERVRDNAEVLGCRGEDAGRIFNDFRKNYEVIFKSQTDETESQKRKETLEIEIRKSLEQLAKAGIDPDEQFTEAFLSYNLKASRTLAMLRILDWQGPGAGLVAPKRERVKHFHLKPHLLETLVIVFSSRYRNQQSRLSLRNFISEVRQRYGIVLGHSDNLEQALGKQDLPVPNRYLLDRNLRHLITMLRDINMLESLSDTAMFVKCPFHWRQEER